MYELQEWLKEISGFAGMTLQPAAGAQGELTGVLIIRAYHQDRGDMQAQQDPDPQFGPRHQPGHLGHERAARWSSSPSDARGNVDLEALRKPNATTPWPA